MANSKKYMLAAVIVTAVGFAYTTSSRRNIPSDFRDSVFDELGGASNADQVIPIPLPPRQTVSGRSVPARMSKTEYGNASAIALKMANYVRGVYLSKGEDVLRKGKVVHQKAIFDDYDAARDFAQGHSELIQWALDANWEKGIFTKEDTVTDAMSLVGLTYDPQKRGVRAAGAATERERACTIALKLANYAKGVYVEKFFDNYDQAGKFTFGTTNENYSLVRDRLFQYLKQDQIAVDRALKYLEGRSKSGNRF